MNEVDIRQLIPKFLYDDMNGRAMAKALEAGLNAFIRTVQQGIDTWGNADAMPEWRLDELAYEYNIPYDYRADIEVKRDWIRNVQALSRLYGTPAGIREYMKGYFSDAKLEEWFEYGGDPFHFRMIFPGEWSPEKIEWATTAIITVKNVRSVLDGYTFNGDWPQNLFSGSGLYGWETGVFFVPGATIEEDPLIDEAGNELLDENGIVLLDDGGGI